MVKKFLVKKDYHNSRLDRWFRNNIQQIPQSYIEKLIRKKNIVVLDVRNQFEFILFSYFQKLKVTIQPFGFLYLMNLVS